MVYTLLLMVWSLTLEVRAPAGAVLLRCETVGEVRYTVGGDVVATVDCDKLFKDGFEP